MFRNGIRWRRAACYSAFAAVMTIGLYKILAQQPGTPAGFEIDGNLACGDDFSGTGAGDDWATSGFCTGVVDPVTDPSTSTRFTDCNWGNQGDKGDTTQFKTGSNKNCDDISGNGSFWSYVSQGGGPQKNDITNVYVHRRPACTVDNDGGGGTLAPCLTDADCPVAGESCHTWIFVGAETRSTNGDSHLDFEINQAGVRLVPDPDSVDPTGCQSSMACCNASTSGKIVGNGLDGGGRTIGDISLDMSFRQGGSQPVLTVRRWDGSSYVFVTEQEVGHTVFSQTNLENANAGSTWTGFESNGASTGLGGTIFALQFVEGGIDQTALGLDFDPCIPDATVLVKSRSSHSNDDEDFCNAQLKDFALFEFPVEEAPDCEAEGDAVCEGDPALLCATASGGVPSYTIVWRDDADAVVETCNNVSEGDPCCLPFAAASAADAGTYSATATDSRPCEGDPCFADLDINPNPACVMDTFDPLNAEPLTGTVTDDTTGAGSYTCTAVVDPPAVGWSIDNCVVVGLQIQVFYTVTQPADVSATVKVTLADGNDCESECELDVTIVEDCDVSDDEVCEGEAAQLCAFPTAGSPPFSMTWEDPSGAAIPAATCNDLDLLENCCLDFPAPPGAQLADAGAYTVTTTDMLGFTSECNPLLVVHENPSCSVEPSSAIICEEETQEFCALPSGGSPPYDVVWRNSLGAVMEDCPDLPADGQCCFTTGVADTYTASVIDDLDCEGECQTTLEVEECPEGCRVTGGGVDCFNGVWSGTDDCNGALGQMKKIVGTDVYTFGGQAGAPKAFQPQPFGEWTHRQHDGPSGKWTFHAGTASAPPGTEIDLITCCDPDSCHPARPALFKQINFVGVGSFKNIHDHGDGGLGGAITGETLHWFEVHIEDLGEPGRNGKQRNPPGFCPLGGFSCAEGDCRCPDFYRIRIHADEDPSSDVIYEVWGYITGGNLQLHPPIDG